MKRLSLLLLFYLAFYTFEDVSSAVVRRHKPPKKHPRSERKTTTTPKPELMTTEAPDEREWESNENVQVSEDEKELASKFFDGFDLDNLADEPDTNIIIDLPEVIDFEAITPLDEKSLIEEAMFQEDRDTRYIKNPDFNARVNEIQEYRFIYDDGQKHYRLSGGPHEKARLIITHEFKNYETISVKIKVDYVNSNTPEPGSISEVVNEINIIRDLQWKPSLKNDKNTNLPIWGETMYRSHGVVMYQETLNDIVMIKNCFEIFFKNKDTGFVICHSSSGNPKDVKSVKISPLTRFLTVKDGTTVDQKLETAYYHNKNDVWSPYNTELL